MSWEKVKEYLESLNSLEKLRKFIAELGYSYENKPILISDPELNKNVEITEIGQANNFPVVFCLLKGLGKEKIDKQMIKTERGIYKRFPENYRNALFISSTDDFSKWHFFNIKQVGTRNLFRRFVIAPSEKLRTAAERISLIKIEPGDTYQEIYSKIEEAFDREALSKKFFKEYRQIFLKIKGEFLKQMRDERTAHLFLQTFLNRLMFIYYIQRKHWILGDPEFIKTMWLEYKRGGNYGKDKFYSDWLHCLFFFAFNKNYGYKVKNLPKNIETALDNAPYLNGGLFREIPGIDGQGFQIKDWMFEEIFENLLDRYNFTIQEDTPFDQYIAINPEMLGIIFESLVNVSEIEDEQHEAGIFYTPRTEVDFMVTRTLAEYLVKNTKIQKDKLYKLIFPKREEQKIPKFNIQEIKEIRDKLDEIKIVDPSCGSGAFLVDALQVILGLKEILTSQEGKEIDRFAEKKAIIERSLYGVDIKEWAVEIAKLRLWLELIVDADETKIDLKSKPLLPSLSLKLRVGDSLVQEIGSIYFPVKGVSQYLSPSLKKKLNELKKEKEDFYYNRQINENVLRQKEISLYESIIDTEINNLKEQKRKIETPQWRGVQEQLLKVVQKEQEAIDFKENEKVAKEKERINQEIQNLEKQKQFILEKKTAFWPIEFAEIFAEKDGFDIVIANPPYVRQELICDLLSKDNSLETRREYKAKLLKAMREDWNDENLNIEKKADLYVYFYLKGLRLLNPQGVFCYISSNSWLDVGYGKDLQEFLLKKIPMIAIYDNQAKRSFKQADINTIIALFDAPKEKKSEKEALNNTVRFVMFKKPFEEVIYSENLIKIEEVKKRSSFEDFRVHPITQKELLEEGMEYGGKKGEKQIGGGEYIGNKWGGKYLRAPDIFYTILEKGKGKLVRLEDITKVRFGIKTGVNEFFYIDEEKQKQWKIEKEFLKLIIKSPRECKNIIINPKKLKFKVFMCNKPKSVLRGTNALKYIEWGEKQKTDSGIRWCEVPSVSGRNDWYDLGEQQKDSYLWSRIHNDSHRIYSGNVYAADTFSVLYPKYDYDITGAILNSTLSWFGKELYGRKVLGEGGLSSLGIDLVNIEVVNPKNITNKIIKIFDKLKLREIENVFIELGFDPNKPIREQKPKPLPDRKALDDIVFDALGLTKEERKEVYWAVCELVKNRLEKAKSL